MKILELTNFSEGACGVWVRAREESIRLAEKGHEVLVLSSNAIKGKDEIAKIEPKIVEGRDPNEELVALCSADGYAIDFGKLSESFVKQSLHKTGKEIEVLLETKVKKISKEIS